MAEADQVFLLKYFKTIVENAIQTSGNHNRSGELKNMFIL